MNAAETQDLSVRYGSTEALKKVNLEVPEAMVYGIIGPDGAGKTTLMRSLCTLLPYSEGSIRVLDFDAKTQSAQIRARIGYMPQRFSLYQDLSVEQNLRFFARLFKVNKQEMLVQREKLYGFSRLKPFAKRLAGNLSGGMKQKLALSCALIHTPKLIILDEPTFGVDPVSRVEFWQILHELKQEGVSIIVSTPYMDEAVQCDQITLLHKGEVIGQGTPNEIIARWQGKLHNFKGDNLQELYKYLQIKVDKADLQLFGSEIHLYSKDELKTELIDTWKHEFPGLSSWEEIQPGMEDVFLKMMQ
ncbi:MAG: ABC transporter ATP-binding protein [Candidatus Cloacimonetes bacterium]|nr:ABC transporter ATP-binding protein [Candidatus Cloacimonadota bacterium]